MILAGKNFGKHRKPYIWFPGGKSLSQNYEIEFDGEFGDWLEAEVQVSSNTIDAAIFGFAGNGNTDMFRAGAIKSYNQIVEIKWVFGGYRYIDGKQVDSYVQMRPTGYIQHGNPGWRAANPAYGQWSGKCYGFRLYRKNGMMVKDYVPVEYQGKAAYYDRISKTYLVGGSGNTKYGEE